MLVRLPVYVLESMSCTVVEVSEYMYVWLCCSASRSHSQPHMHPVLIGANVSRPLTHSRIHSLLVLFAATYSVASATSSASRAGKRLAKLRMTPTVSKQRQPQTTNGMNCRWHQANKISIVQHRLSRSQQHTHSQRPNTTTDLQRMPRTCAQTQRATPEQTKANDGDADLRARARTHTHIHTHTHNQTHVRAAQ